VLDAYLNRKTEYEILPMTGEDCHAVSGLHGERFAKGWGDGEFHSLLTQRNVFGFVARQTSGFFKVPLSGFVLSREAAGEAEILTIAVSSKIGRSGLGWRLMQAAMREAGTRGAASLFLEVDDGNVAALGLYRKLGFEKVGERPSYYVAPDGRRTTALVMRRDLR
jgi:[ribosomal protein S18]-alanine N-acetyltransferase